MSQTTVKIKYNEITAENKQIRYSVHLFIYFNPIKISTVSPLPVSQSSPIITAMALLYF